MPSHYNNKTYSIPINEEWLHSAQTNGIFSWGFGQHRFKTNFFTCFQLYFLDEHLHFCDFVRLCMSIPSLKYTKRNVRLKCALVSVA